ncbi:MAG: hypothetical protein WB424_00750 [Terracidiphilus sp.]
MPPKVVSQAEIEVAKRKANSDSRAPVYGKWERFEPTENRGYSWFPFDVINWLTSPVVNAMSPTAQGIYIRLLAVQWRDGYVSTDPKSLAVQTGFDARTCIGWFDTWGDRLFVCLDHPEGGCDVLASLRNCQEPSATTGKSRRLPASLRNRPEVSGTCRKCVNGKLHFLAIKQGKLSLVADTEERRANGKGDRKDSTFFVPNNDPSLLSNGNYDGNDKDPIEFLDVPADASGFNPEEDDDIV